MMIIKNHWMMIFNIYEVTDLKISYFFVVKVNRLSR